jgi:hypothetical protein
VPLLSGAPTCTMSTSSRVPRYGTTPRAAFLVGTVPERYGGDGAIHTPRAAFAPTAGVTVPRGATLLVMPEPASVTSVVSDSGDGSLELAGHRQ